ncbi:MAG: hypothetical protein D4R45_04405 [Planctomycetaceae bacterium]|nr:MAG: hypothetical protein D4R45_04405 [Planctomycetaceae bacterium]
MATLLIDRVAQRLGQSAAANTNFPTKAMIVNSLNEGTIEVARKLTPYAMPEHIKESVVSASKTQGLAIPSDYIKDVQLYLSSTYANVRRVPTFLKFLLKDSTSMHYAKTDDMAYYFRQNRIIVEPSGSISASSFTIVYVAEPLACTSATNESYASWNRDVENLAIDYGVIRGKESQLGDYSEKFKTALALAKTRSVSAVSTLIDYSITMPSVSSVSTLDSMMPSQISISALTMSASIGSVSLVTAPSISSVSFLDGLLPSSASLATLHTLSLSVSITSVSAGTAPTFSASLPTPASVWINETRIINVLNAASRAVSILGTQILADDFEKGQEYILQAGEYLKQASEEVNRENIKISNYSTRVNKAIGEYQTNMNKYLQKFGSDIERAVNQTNAEIKEYEAVRSSELGNWRERVAMGIQKYQSQVSKAIPKYQADVNLYLQKYNLQMQKQIAYADRDIKEWSNKQQMELDNWKSKSQTAIDKYNARVNKISTLYTTQVNGEIGKNRLLLEKAGLKLQAAQSEIQVAGTYIQNNAGIQSDIKEFRIEFKERIADINSRFARAG